MFRSISSSILFAIFQVLFFSCFIVAAQSSPEDEQTEPNKSYILTADVTYVSDYITRGRSINGGTPAIQGNALFIYDNFFLGVWATSLDVGTYEAEIDYYGGYRFGLAQTTTLDVYAQVITVPELEDFTFLRMNAVLSGRYSNLNWKLKAAYDPQIDGTATENGDNAYILLTTELPIEKTAFSFKAGIGYEKGIAVATADEDKFDWHAGLAAKAYGLNLEMKYIATDAQEVYEPRLLFSVQKVF